MTTDKVVSRPTFFGDVWGFGGEANGPPIIEAKKMLSWTRLDVSRGGTSPNAQKPGGVSGVVLAGGNGGTGTENEREAASSVSR